MAKKKTINVITAVTDPILGTTYKSQPVPVVSDKVAIAQKQFDKISAQKTSKIRSERTKKK